MKKSQKQWIAIVVSIVVIALFFALGANFSSLFGQNSNLNQMNINESFSSSVNGFEVNDTLIGTGEEAVPGKVVVVHYTGAFTDGRVFDSSRTRGVPFEFTLGAGQVIQGWEKGIAGMKVGGRRELIIPGDMGYGPQGYPGVIPPNATLVFEVELLDVK